MCVGLGGEPLSELPMALGHHSHSHLGDGESRGDEDDVSLQPPLLNKRLLLREKVEERDNLILPSPSSFLILLFFFPPLRCHCSSQRFVDAIVLRCC